jgi:hypothetical protein
MNKSSDKTPPLILPTLQDPPSAGVFFVRHMTTIVALILMFLMLSIIAVTSLIRLDVTIRADVGAIVKCGEKGKNHCARIHVSGENAKKIALDNRALLVVDAEGSYRRKSLEATVTAIGESADYDDGNSSRAVTIELADGRPPPGTSPTFALIVVGSQSALQLMMASEPSF